MSCSKSNPYTDSCSRKANMDLYTSPDIPVLQLLCPLYQDKKLTKLLPILFHKYQSHRIITKSEIQDSVDPRYHKQFPTLFKIICECMCLAFGIEVREMHPPSGVYILRPMLGLTYRGILRDDYQSISKINLLVVLLIVIFLKGNRISEVDLKEFLRTREMLPQRNRFEIGDPWEFIKSELVQNQYLQRRQVPNSFPAQYEFLWGPKTYAETSKMKVLEHLAKVNRRDPKSYRHLYDDALREEQSALRQ